MRALEEVAFLAFVGRHLANGVTPVGYFSIGHIER